MGQRPIGESEITGFLTFLNTIDWSERWLQGLIAFHVIWLLIIVTTRKYTNLQAVIFVFLLTLVYCSEYINEWASNNSKLFSNQQYFDSTGLFISLVFSTPILVNCLVIVINWVWNACSLLISVKRAQLREKIKSRQSNGKEESESTEEKTEERKSKDSGKKND